MSMNEDDPLLRIHESRREEAKKDAKLRLEIQKKELESQKRIIESRRLYYEKLQKVRSGET